MRISQEGIDFIKQWEKFRADWYRCSAGVWTIGYGHLEDKRDGEVTDEDLPPMMKAPIDEEDAELLLEDDLQFFEIEVNSLVDVDLNQNQFDALVSFSFNVGTGRHGFGGSTLRKKVNQEDYEGAAEEFKKWVYANGEKLRGLELRREAEKRMFLEEDYSDIEPVSLDPAPIMLLPQTEFDPKQFPLREVYT